MNARRSSLATLIALACTAALTLAGCSGGGGGKNSLAKFCKDFDTLSSRYSNLDTIDVLDPTALSTLKHLAHDMYQLAAEAPVEMKASISVLADDVSKAVNGQGDSVDEDKYQTIADAVDTHTQAKCKGAGASDAAAKPASATTVDTTPDTTFDTSTFDTTPDTTADTTADTTPEPSITMPDLQNATVDDAKAQLTSAGITSDPVIVEQKDATVAPGLVVEQEPSAGSNVTASDTVTLTVSALPDLAYLSDLRASDGSFRTGVASIKGVPYTHGVLQSQSAGSSPQKTTFTLSSHYSQLKGVVGLDDSFTGGASVQVEIFDQDNKSLFKKTVKVGLPVTIDIPVTGVIQLTLEATDLLSTVSNSGTVVWGDVRVLSGS
jgi:PASTA domain/NPCBM/NEW2 domain